jgi:hypothetical protein
MSVDRAFRVVSPAPRDIWLETLAADPNSLIFQTPTWTDMVCAGGRYIDASRYYESIDGHHWVLPLLRSKSIASGLARQASLPKNWGPGGVISSTNLCAEDIRMIFADIQQQPALQTVLQPNPLLSPLWESAAPAGISRDARVTHILDLEGGFDAVWEKRFQSTTRTAIRKAERSNLTIEWDSSGKLIPAYFDMFMTWAMRRGRERHLPDWLVRWTNRQRDPQERFEKILQFFGDSSRIYVAFLDGEPVAATVFLVYGKHAFYYRGTSLREKANPVRANDLLQCMMIQEACRAGCRYYHMGESGGVESLMRFKAGFGAIPTPILGYAVERLPLTQLGNGMDRLLKGVERRLLARPGTSG